MQVSVTRLRQDLPAYLRKAQSGSTVSITSHGKVIARLVPEEDATEAARERLAALRGKATFTDLESPISGLWDAQSGRL